MISRKYTITQAYQLRIKTNSKGFYKGIGPCVNLYACASELLKNTISLHNIKKKVSFFWSKKKIFKKYGSVFMKKVSNKVKLLGRKSIYVEYVLLKNLEVIPNMPSNFIFKNKYLPKVTHVWLCSYHLSGVSSPLYSIEHFNNIGLHKIVGFGNSLGRGFPHYKNNFYSFIRGLVDFFLKESFKSGYEELGLPVLVKPRQVFNTGQLPDKEKQMFLLEKDDLYLIPTSEISITNSISVGRLSKNKLPLLYSSYSLCFRREIGNWGRLNKGLNRVHQFDKVELVKIVVSRNSNSELMSLSDNIRFLLEKLNLSYRIINIGKSSLSFSANKQLDLEVWLYGQKQWLEVSSCSNLTDFQSRRMKVYFLDKKAKKLPHTLNGSGLAVQRVVVAILENYMREQGEVKTPCILKYRYFYKNIEL